MDVRLQSAIIILIEIFCCKIFFGTFFRKRKWPVYFFPIWIICFLIVDYYFVFKFFKYFYVKQIIVILIYCIFMSLYYQNHISRIFICSLLFQALLLTVDYISIVFIKIIAKEEDFYILSGEHNQLLIIFSKSILIIFIMAIKRKWEKEQNDINIMSSKEWCKLISYPIMTIFTIAAMLLNFDIVSDDHIFIIFNIACALVGTNLIQYYLVNDLLAKEKKIRINEVYKVKLENQMQAYYEMSENLKKQRKSAHEYKNKILCIKSLLHNKNYQELEAYIQELSDNINDELNVIDTNNIIINAVLNIKYHEAKEKNILMVLRINDLSKVDVSNMDIVILLSNLLNNAIEGCDKCEDKKIIRIKMVYEEGNLILSVSNNYKGDLKYYNNIFLTTKEIDREEHGIGLINVIDIINKYEGIYDINIDNDQFTFTTIISV